MDSGENSEISNNEVTLPLSPVLCSGQSKKLLKNRIRNRRVLRKCKSALSYNIEYQNGSKSECNVSAAEPNPHFQNTTDQETVADRIKRLEALEKKRLQIINTISFSSIIPNDLQSNQTTDKTLARTDQILPLEECTGSTLVENTEIQRNAVNIPEFGNFQTGSGKQIAVSKPQIEISKKLFDDIFLSGVSRDNKYNYLHCNSTQTSAYNNKFCNISAREPVAQSRLDSLDPTNKDIIGNNQSPKTKIPSTDSKSKDVCEEDIFEDLSLENDAFQAASLQLEALFSSERRECSMPVLKKQINHSKENILQGTKKIFEGENFDDLIPGCHKGFQAASLLLNTSCKDGLLNLEKRDDYMPTLERQIENAAEKTRKNIFHTENLDDLNIGSNKGFQSASVHLNTSCNQPNQKLLNFEKRDESMPVLKKQIENPIEKTPDRRKNIFEGENFDDLKPACSGFQATSLHFKQPLRPSEVSSGNVTYSNKPKIFETSNMQLSATKSPQPNHNSKCSENTVRSNSSIISDNHSLNKPASLGTKQSKGSVKQRNIFADENFDDLNLGGIVFQTANTLQKQQANIYQRADKSIAAQVKKTFKDIFEGESFDSGASFTTKIFKPPTRNFKYSGDFRSPLKTILEDRSECEATNDLKGFPLLEQQQTLNISDKYSEMLEKIHAHFQCKKSGAVKPLLSIQSIGKLAETINSNKEKLNWKAKTIISRKRKICEVDSDCNISDLNCSSTTSSGSKRPKKRLGCFASPTIQVQPSGIKMATHLFQDLEPKTFSTSTPVKFENLLKPQNCNSTPIPSARKKLDSMFSPSAYNTSLDLSKTIHKSLNSTVMTVHSNTFSLSKPAEADARVWLGNLDKERLLLQEQLRIVNEKQAILAQQATILDLPMKEKIKPKPGLLYESKRKTNRVRLQEYVQYSEPGAQAGADGFLDQINPQNSHLMHFISGQRISHVTTEDGAVIIPNVDSKIGISEIEHSFKLLEGVDRTLIPSNWIRNHYKWIIWKLASYERMFPHIFDGCLSVENVMQQLKYRYDVEIDRAQRSALRKIFEADDCPQKRMVLCVSKVIKINDTYELELTDGWYPIRTVIDLPLCDQITRGKIKIGTKMIVCGAELMNCEGCHPLEATDLIHLKISFNSTRRALWWCKLGYQKQAGPFVIPLSSINMNGGKIGCLKCFILRVYPVKFLETCGSKKVWRNQKADERSEQNFYSEKFRRVDSLHNKSADNGVKSMSYKDVKNIEDPQILYDILQRSKDPENLQEMLTSTQNTILYNYSLDKSTSTHTTEWNDDKTSQRAVKALLKIKIVDACYNSDKIHDLQVWKPTENHLHELREGEIVTLFNTSCSSVWGLNASQNTQFKIEGRSSDRKFEKFKRKVTHIKDMETFFDNSLFNEFDTVGIVVKKIINEADQQVWMADREQRLLLINICDSPKNILVLDMINEGQIVSVCNLIFQHHLDTHSFAVGNHYVIFARYSKHKHLQEALDGLEKDFKDIDRHDFILRCTSKIKHIGLEKVGRNPMDLDDMECSQITTTDIALLECLEKLA
ncbi:hypothetical protein HUJ04_003554 [Dendroctonus ponderosae]|uniref:Tower domain-containing protein n=1 Tax=Dendroctonus ponderosae TaxID=77166 RepID=A0AAR5QIF1_DENPD|nr:hypothetical protein HUJ04_003554 [Dendroctonus ponderosae]